MKKFTLENLLETLTGSIKIIGLTPAPTIQAVTLFEGLVFCAFSLDKQLLKNTAIKEIQYKQAKHVVIVSLKEGQVNDNKN